MKIFSGSSSKTLAKEIAGSLKLVLSSLEIHAFPDGEKRIRILRPVVGENVVLVQSTGIPTDENYMELFLSLDALKRSGAEFITAVIPYLGYSRQDHVFLDGEGVSLSAIIKILEALGMDKIITMDLHSIKTPELFKAKVVHLSAIPQFGQEIKKLRLDNYVIVTPDLGGIRRVELLSKLLGEAEIVKITKERDLLTGKVETTNMEGSVAGKNAIILDDIISTGKTLLEAVNKLKQKGTKKIYVFATHGVFAKGASELLQNSQIEKVYVTDTLSISKADHFDKLTILPVGKLLAAAII